MKWWVCCMSCGLSFAESAQMGDFVVLVGVSCGRFRAAFRAVGVGVFGVLSWRVRGWGHGGALSGARWAKGKMKKGSSDAEVQSDEPKIENMDGCLMKSEHGVGASSALVLRLCRETAARRGIVVWTMVGEGRRATARWWVFGRKRGRLTGGDYCLLAYDLYRLA